MIGPTSRKILVNFCWWSGPGYGFRITFPLPLQL